MKKKWRINWKKVGRNLLVITTLIVLGVVIHTAIENGASYFSTIGYFE